MNFWWLLSHGRFYLLNIICNQSLKDDERNYIKWLHKRLNKDDWMMSMCCYFEWSSKIRKFEAKKKNGEINYWLIMCLISRLFLGWNEIEKKPKQQQKISFLLEKRFTLNSILSIHDFPILQSIEKFEHIFCSII